MSISIDYMITAKCNLTCPFCYGPDPAMKGEIALLEKLGLTRFLISKGMQRIIIAGGEPLVSADLLAFIENARQLGVGVAVQTNGFSHKKVGQIAPFLDWLALPLDAAESTTHQYMRTTTKQLDNTLRAIAVARAANPTIRIKIGTVVTKRNIGEISMMVDLIRRVDPDVWKLYEVRPRGQALQNYSELRVTRSQLDFEVAALRERYNDSRIHYSPCDATARAYLIINPDTECLIPDGPKYLSAGHLLGQAGIFQDAVWERAVSLLHTENHVSNVTNSFPGW